MNKEFLEGLGLEADAIETIMAEHEKTVQAEQVKTTAKEAELKTAKETISGLQDSIKKFDGVDVEQLQQEAKDWETKYNEDLKAEKAKAENVRKEYALKEAMAHLFKKESSPYDPKGSGSGAAVNPFAKETFNMTKQGELFKQNPEQARAMAAAAGVKL